MQRHLDRALLVCFPAIVALVGASVVGVPYAFEGALLAILFGGACLGLERLVDDPTALDLLAGVLLPAGAVVGAVVGVFRIVDPSLAFLPMVPGLVALWATRGESPARKWAGALFGSR